MDGLIYHVHSGIIMFSACYCYMMRSCIRDKQTPPILVFLQPKLSTIYCPERRHVRVSVHVQLPSLQSEGNLFFPATITLSCAHSFTFRNNTTSCEAEEKASCIPGIYPEKPPLPLGVIDKDAQNPLKPLS